MDVYAQIAVKIIAGQEAIIGPMAVEQARQVSDIAFDWDHHEVTITGDKMATIENLIQKYKELFGNISVEVSKNSASALMKQLSIDQLPSSLR